MSRGDSVLAGPRRIQLSLYVPSAQAGELERVRRALDPVQAALIPAHVTLCRDEEAIEVDAETISARLLASGLRPITLRFGIPRPFSGHGLLLPCIDGRAAFDAVRGCVLGGTPIRAQEPHLTLAHPRNPRVEVDRSEILAGWPEEISVEFPSVRLIEQRSGAPWRVVREFALAIA